MWGALGNCASGLFCDGEENDRGGMPIFSPMGPHDLQEHGAS